ncbi:MAG: hypothetical protein JNJ54_34910 [Myxococcaceae bacterium]|nr:hypothetical protein [Myxococcaceae bacterium]
MATRGNVFQQGPLEVTSVTTAAGQRLITLADASGLVQYEVTLPAVDVRELHRQLGAWIDAEEQERVRAAGSVTAWCIKCGGRTEPRFRYGNLCDACSPTATPMPRGEA